MQEFDITIVDKPDKANLVAELLSHLHVLEDPAVIEDSFLDELLFLLPTKNPWYANTNNYLTTGRTLVHFSPK